MYPAPMTEGDRARWDAKHEHAPAEAADVDAFVAAVLDRLGPGAGRRALDLASGTGRHALELAHRGWNASAWDVSPVGLGVLARRADVAGVVVTTREVDLLAPIAKPPDEPFDLVLVVNFLERPLLARLAEFVRPGGYLVFATFTVDRPGQKPPLRFCLGRGELRTGLPGFETIAVEEAEGRAGWFGKRV